MDHNEITKKMAKQMALLHRKAKGDPSLKPIADKLCELGTEATNIALAAGLIDEDTAGTVVQPKDDEPVEP